MYNENKKKNDPQGKERKKLFFFIIWVKKCAIGLEPIRL
jgi:hypothetical protein